MIRLMILTAKSEDAALTCLDCVDNSKNWEYYEKKLKKNPYIEGPSFSINEIEIYSKQLKKEAKKIESFKDTFPELNKYMARMSELTTPYKGQKCQYCQKSFDFLKYENLHFGLKEDTTVCDNCYDKNIKILVDHNRELIKKKREVFFGIGDPQIKQEMGIYNKLRVFEKYAQHLLEDNLREWFLLMKDNAEEPIVECANCGKPFKNNPHAKMFVGDDKFYACSGDCKARVADKARKEKKQEKQKQMID